MSLSEFLAGPEVYRMPAPGGALFTGKDVTNCDADLFMAELAALLKRKAMAPTEMVETLHRKIAQIEVQTHYGAETDVLIIARINSWIREISQ